VIDFSKWTEEAYASMTDEYYSSASWILSSDKKSVVETQNSQPALFFSDFQAMNSSIHLKIKPMMTSEPDDDYFGFAIGFQLKDTDNHQADYLLIDWKNSIPGENLYKDFVSPGDGGSAKVGLALSRVQGVPTPDEFWQHVDQDLAVSPIGEGLTELARGKNTGNSGWVFDQSYDFSFEFNQTSLKVYVDDVLEIQVTGNFSDGRVAFYGSSQAGVIYSAS
jgi:hypothetical protein